MKIERFCLQCGEVLPEGTPNNLQYCNDACKQTAYRECLSDSEEDSTEKVEDGGLALVGLLGLGLWLFNTAQKK